MEYLAFQSTRPVRGATPDAIEHTLSVRVSIHAPRAGRDQGNTADAQMHRCFNPRAPCGARH